MRLPPVRLPTIAQNNQLLFSLLAALPAAFGSAISVILIVSDVWAVISLAMGRFRLRYRRSDWIVVLPALFYVAVMLASIALHFSTDSDLGIAVTPLAYLSLPLLIPRLRAAEEVDYFAAFVRAAPWCGVLLLPIMIVQVIEGMPRIDSFAGNPFPFAMICAFVGSAALLNMPHASRRMAALSVIGFLICAAGVMLSETRTVWVSFLVNLIVLAWYFVGNGLVRRRPFITAGIVVLLLALAAFFHGRIEQRLGLLTYDLQALADGEVPRESAAVRLGLWTHGFELAEQRPLFGYGPNHRSQIIRHIPIEVSTTPGKPPRITTVAVSHFHNGFLTAMIDAGLIGVLATLLLLVSPLALALLAPRDEVYRKRLTFALLLFFTYAITGEFNIMFGQDLIDSLFVTGCLVLALSVGTGPKRSPDRVGAGG